jgi:ATP-dependent Lon protease
MAHRLVPVVPLEEACLFPESSLEIADPATHVLRALEVAQRVDGEVVAIALRSAEGRELHDVGTIATIAELTTTDEMTLLELDGHRRARVVHVYGTDVLVAEIEEIPEGAVGEAWDGAVEVLARFVHTHPKLRAFLDKRRRSNDPMAWVNLVCQHLPIRVATRQQLLECMAEERCQRIGRVLDALMQKEQGG